ncbi:hypothetical protein IMG5_075510 [Ichthyophthirius multifiliis]|uniref:Uncharacterized protein n=1 Tax=Ichthyophthirius multifiliis TaxID=5932 RepID=G0QQ54_ICHMU|nr:hypothetical protein IMG5_075510 [Ichthyophthirius multifiliis]EGR32650.1 hypothetical protein IMG5_075510 [Ichthyophthirius multifiliis]|eukprot:XP_004036636.1 hypothetical protein IMG5_075510 [Ichthyophthirius multifiliis]
MFLIFNKQLNLCSFKCANPNPCHIVSLPILDEFLDIIQDFERVIYGNLQCKAQRRAQLWWILTLRRIIQGQ